MRKESDPPLKWRKPARSGSESATGGKAYRRDKRYHRHGRSAEHSEKCAPRSVLYGNPRPDPALKSVFEKIGIPEAEPFVPDPFQVEALRHIEAQDVLVSAPTGSGKTWIAIQAIQRFLERGLNVWYASPLKALSNAIYQEFSKEFGSGRCGIITGDRKENPDAPVVVGTTEILRNQLYDAMHEGIGIRADLVVLDEAHYLSDPDRGVVWEEVLIYLPARVRLLLLSATISNAGEVTGWLSEIRGTANRVVRSEERPVPLEFLFLFPDGLISPLAGKRGISPRVKKFITQWSGKRGHGTRKLQFGRILEVLRRLDLLPAIFFLKSRMECDRALLTLSLPPDSGEVRRHLKEAVNRFVADYPHLRHHRQTRVLIECLAGSHHGGQLPYWKVLIEKMMNRGYLEAIFSTSTVAAGVNFPARTVVLVQSDRYNGREFIDLTATDLHQMIGRAGRRGKDRIGFVAVIPGLHQDPALVHALRDSPPEPLQSQIRIDFSMTLNLLLSHTPVEVKALLDRSFAAFQGTRSGDLWLSFRQHLRFLKETRFVDHGDRLTADGIWASKLRLDQPLLIAEAIRRGGFSEATPSTLAGGLAPFVWDRVQEMELNVRPGLGLTKVEAIFNRTITAIEPMRHLMAERGFETPQILLWPAAAVYLWTKGMAWAQLMNILRVDEGDLASLIMRTADHLRQVTNLAETHAELAGVARQAIAMVLREPVYIE